LGALQALAECFNTTGFNNMENPVYSGTPVSMLFCTDDASARKTGEQLIRDATAKPAISR